MGKSGTEDDAFNFVYHDFEVWTCRLILMLTFTLLFYNPVSAAPALRLQRHLVNHDLLTEALDNWISLFFLE